MIAWNAKHWSQYSTGSKYPNGRASFDRNMVSIVPPFLAKLDWRFEPPLPTIRIDNLCDQAQGTLTCLKQSDKRARSAGELLLSWDDRVELHWYSREGHRERIRPSLLITVCMKAINQHAAHMFSRSSSWILADSLSLLGTFFSSGGFLSCMKRFTNTWDERFVTHVLRYAQVRVQAIRTCMYTQRVVW